MNLSIVRKNKGMTQWDIRIATGIHQSKISLIERGYVAPTEEEKRIIAQALGLDISGIGWPELISKRSVQQ